jgi:hypothetical protein
LDKWMKPLEDFSCFSLDDRKCGTEFEWCWIHCSITDKGTSIDDVNCFDQLSNLKEFTENCINDKEFNDLLSHQKWTKYSESSKNVECHSELLRIAQFVLLFPPTLLM